MQHPERVGLLSGTFDPIHEGHLALARAALEQLGLDEVWLLVNPQTPGKTGVTAWQHRQAMAAAVAAKTPWLVTGREPVQRQAQPYSAATARQLAADPDTRFVLLMGSDTYAGLDDWPGIQDIRAVMTVAVAARLKHVAKLQPGDVSIIMPDQPVSSRTIRENLAAGKPAAGLPPAVADYIRHHHLYGA